MADLPRVFGRYVLLKALGSGGTGDVHLARPNDGSGNAGAVVIKRLHSQLAEQPDFVRRFQHEASIAIAVDSPNVAKVFDIGRVDDTFYIAMAYIPGWTLARLAGDLEESGGQASIESIAEVVIGALEGLAALHSAVDPNTGTPLCAVHRDIAPKNIMVGEDGITRLIDLGLGKSTLQDWKTGTGVVMGSPGYMAPEQVVAENVDKRADIYAMGIVLWEFLTQAKFIKRAPLPLMLRAQAAPKLRPPSSLRSDVPAELDQVVMKALALDPNDRYDSAPDFIAAIRQVIPAAGGKSALATLVGEMLWGELSVRKTEVTHLLSRVTPTPHSGAAAGVEVYAQRPMPTPVMSPMSSPHAAAPTPTPYAYSGLNSAPYPQRSGGISARAVVALMALTLLLGVAGTLVITQSNSTPLTTEALPVRTIDTEPKLVERPGVTSLGASESEDEGDGDNDEPEESSAPKKRRPAKRIAAEVPPAPPPPVTKAPTLSSLLARAQSLQKKAPDRAEPKSLVVKISMELQRSNVAPDRVLGLAAEVAQLEKSIP